VYDPDATFNPSTKKSYWPVAGPNYAFMFFTNQLPGASDATRNYAEETKWVDANRRDQLIYRCGFPTNVGIDIQLVARQFTCNWNNINDFLLYEFTFKNTGGVDIDGDGTPEKTNHKIEAFTFGTAREVVMGSGGSELAGTRGTDFSCARLSGYVGDDDPEGNPWDMSVSFPGAALANLNPDGTPKGPGKSDFGMNNYGAKTFLDRWMGMNWLAAKQGTGSPANPDKKTIFGTHAIGVGKERGQYHATGNGANLIVGTRFDGLYISGVPINGPKIVFTAYAGPYFADGGKTNDAGKIRAPRPNPNFFASGDSDRVTNWVVKPTIKTKLDAGQPLTEAERPNGDQKLNSLDPALTSTAFNQKWEDGKATATTDYPAGWGKWTKGYSMPQNFDQGFFTGIGPFSLDVNETMTVVFVEYAGYRLEGVQRSVRAARWAYEKGWKASPAAYTLPISILHAPDMRVDITPTGSVKVRWDARAEADADFAGYKVWRSTNAPPNFKWAETGMRVVDRYQEQMTPGPTDPQFIKPINPKFDAFADINATSIKGEGQGREWGPYQLVAVVPKAQLATVTEQSGTFKYVLEDTKVVYGFDYWYYVSAYKEGTYTGPGNETTTRIESSNLNRNGRSGIWLGTYSYADNNTFFPGNPGFIGNVDQGKKDIGARFTVRSRTAALADLNSGLLKPGVTPNPYKRAAAFDNIQSSTDHKIKFFNLPARGRITIIDVAGQIIDQVDFDNQTGVSDVTWDMFSKDGVEVANGLYIWVLEAGDGVSGANRKVTYVGKLAVMR
jgi:hypothetical protein